MKKFLLVALATLNISASPPPLLRPDLVAMRDAICKNKNISPTWHLGVYDTLITVQTVPSSKNIAARALEIAKKNENGGYMHGSCSADADADSLPLSRSAEPCTPFGFVACPHSSNGSFGSSFFQKACGGWGAKPPYYSGGLGGKAPTLSRGEFKRGERPLISTHPRFAWIITVSAPYPPKVRGRNVTLSKKLKDYCKSLHVKFAEDAFKSPITLPLRDNTFILPSVGNGIAAVSCKSLEPQKRGPRLLYVFPVGEPRLRAPLFSAQKARDVRQQTITWVNAVRAKLSLPPLRLVQSLSKHEPRLSVIHDRVELAAQKKTLHGHLLGENRTRAHTLAEALAMLWVSPFHRSLLLHKQATSASIDVAQRDGQIMLALLVMR